MRCYSGKDYYDNVNSYDGSIIFNRTNKSLFKAPINNLNKFEIKVLFCGKMYTLFYISDKIFSTQEAFLNYFTNEEDYYSKVGISRWTNERFNYRSADSYWVPVDYTDFCVANKITVASTHFVNKYAYLDSFTMSDSKVVLMQNNFSELGTLNFQKVFDPYTANMEIERWIDGVLTNNSNNMVNISDTSKLIKAGFDNRISFRHRKV